MGLPAKKLMFYYGAMRRHINWAARTVRIELFILLIGISLLLVFVSLYLWSTSKITGSEFDRVDKTKYQAVSVNRSANAGDKLYFGHIVKLNDKYLVLRNVYYLAEDSLHLAKLGCEIHAPYDELVINRASVAYWQNLRDGGKIAKAIEQYRQQNAGRLDCGPAPAINP